MEKKKEGEGKEKKKKKKKVKKKGETTLLIPEVCPVCAIGPSSLKQAQLVP